MKFEIEQQRMYVRDGDRVVGNLYFPTVSGIVVLESVFVHPNFRHHTIGAQLVAKFVQMATVNHLTVKVLDPFAKLEFVKHPEYRSVVVQ